MADLQITARFSLVSLALAKYRLDAIRNGLRDASLGAVNDTTKQVQRTVIDAIRGHVNIKMKDIRPHVKRTRATKSSVSARVTIEDSPRLNLGKFGARQNKKGVSYKIEKGGKRGMVKGAFGPLIDRLGRQVYKRAGKERLPIIKLRGLSPWGVIAKNPAILKKIKIDASTKLNANLKRRVNFLLLKHAGKV